MRTDEMMDLKNLSRDDVQVALAAMGSKSEAIALMKEHGGVEALSDLPESKFALVVQAAHAAVAGSGKVKPHAKAQAQPKTMADIDSAKVYDRWNSAGRK